PGLCLTDCRCGDSSQVLRLAPVADTYIQAGAQATADHGASDHVDVDLAPADIAYLKFDLSAVTRPVVAAKLKLHCTNASSDGGTIYPVPNSSWAEGSGVGSASGPGLKWSDVDTNLDGKHHLHDQHGADDVDVDQQHGAHDPDEQHHLLDQHGADDVDVDQQHGTHDPDEQHQLLDQHGADDVDVDQQHGAHDPDEQHPVLAQHRADGELVADQPHHA